MKDRRNLCLREADREDVDLLFEWVNDPDTRRNAFCSQRISYEEHKQWFERAMEDNDTLILILVDNEEPIGQIRFSREGDRAEIDYSIARDYRGLGYGKLLLSTAIDEVRKRYPTVRKLIGKVKPQNQASAHCFETNGFSERYRQYELTI